ncbi:DUF917 domain-containing protein [bacterium]|nr:DUF917 domain-containing protein [bacterium]
MMRTLNREELEDILWGCTLLGTGGGGDFAMGWSRIEADLAAGREFRMVSLDELDDEDMIGSPYFCGSLISIQKAGKEGVVVQDIFAFEALQDHFGKPFAAAISTELGGLNTASALSVAANMGIPIVDADPAGRAVPELQHSTFFLNDIPMVPMAIASRTEKMIITEAFDDLKAEALVRGVALLNNGNVGVTDHVVKGKVLKKTVIGGMLSYAEQLGKAIREKDCEKAAQVGGGFVLFQGTVNSISCEEREGFTWGNVFIRNGDDEYEIRYKNEHYVSFRNSEIDVTVPDLICIMDSETAEPITNPNCKEGDNVTVVGFPGPKEWRTERGLKIFGPPHFNLDDAYIPIEEKYK